MNPVVPTEGTCDHCGVELDEEDGYHVHNADGTTGRFCDDCPPGEGGGMTRDDHDEFCCVCGVALDLHPDEIEGQGCETADRKATLLAAFFRRHA